MTSRCPDCDKPIATDEDERTTKEGEGEHLCWRRWNLGRSPDGFCAGPRVDWRARCLAMMPVVEAAERYYDQHGAIETMRDLATAVTKYRKWKESA